MVEKPKDNKKLENLKEQIVKQIFEGDEGVDLDLFLRFQDALFDTKDKNNNGTITPAEDLAEKKESLDKVKEAVRKGEVNKGTLSLFVDDYNKAKAKAEKLGEKDIKDLMQRAKDADVDGNNKITTQEMYGAGIDPSLMSALGRAVDKGEEIKK